MPVRRNNQRAKGEIGPLLSLWFFLGARCSAIIVRRDCPLPQSTARFSPDAASRRHTRASRSETCTALRSQRGLSLASCLPVRFSFMPLFSVPVSGVLGWSDRHGFSPHRRDHQLRLKPGPGDRGRADRQTFGHEDEHRAGTPHTAGTVRARRPRTRDKVRERAPKRVCQATAPQSTLQTASQKLSGTDDPSLACVLISVLLGGYVHCG
jgi:hypothetical protein